MDDISPGLTAADTPPSRDPTVVVRDAVKIYGKNNVVLRGLNMTVPKGQIYGLLGPSGCGKTTLLSTIIGRSKLDSGDIMVKAFKREDIGYMPQDLNLHEYLTIFQTFKFYGRMLNMDNETILEKSKELVKLLELPPTDRLIDTLSGGQQRRVSLGVALLHNPIILILDEPTVGLDPVLSHSIWDHMVSFAGQGKTIIITTHYIEEARQANTIGMMRGGVLLAEESPELLMARCNAVTLEEAFLTLSHKQETSTNTQIDDTYKKLKNAKKPNKKLNLDDGFFRPHRMNCLLYKNVSLLWQQKPFLAFLFLLPLVQTYFFNLAIGHDPQGLSIAVVNDELQQRHTAECKPEFYQGCFLDDSQNILMSCAYVDKIQSKSMKILQYDDVDTALKAVKRNDAWALLYFPTNYTNSLAIRFANATRTSNLDVEISTVQTWVDLSNQYIGNMVKANVMYSMQQYLGDAMTKCNISTKVGNIPILFKEPIYGSVDTTYIHFASASILCLCCYYLPVLLTAGLILTEKKGGIMERMMVSGIKFSEVLASSCLMQMTIHVVQTAISMYVMYVYFDNPYKGDHFITVVLLLLIGMEGMIFGFLVGAVCTDFVFAAYLGAGSNMVMSSTCGMMWPLEGAHYLLKITGPFWPMTMPVKALLAITAKGWTIETQVVYMGFVSIFVWCGIMTLMIFIYSRFNKDLWVVRK